jgi:hypothetical protein
VRLGRTRIDVQVGHQLPPPIMLGIQAPFMIGIPAGGRRDRLAMVGIQAALWSGFRKKVN